MGAPKKENQIDWDNVPEIGKMVDAEVGKIYGVSVASVTSARKRRGIPSFLPRRVGDKTRDAMGVCELGKRPDYEVAKMYGMSTSTIRTARVKKGIPPYDCLSVKKGLVYDNDELGGSPDAEIARNKKVSASTIRGMRCRRGIAAFDKYKNAQFGVLTDREIADEYRVSVGTIRNARIFRCVPRSFRICEICGIRMSNYRPGKMHYCNSCSNYVGRARKETNSTVLVKCIAKSSLIENLTEEKILKYNEKMNGNHE